MADQKKYFEKKYLEVFILLFVISTNLMVIMPQENSLYTLLYIIATIFGVGHIWHDTNTSYVRKTDTLYNITFDLFLITIFCSPIILMILLQWEDIFSIKNELVRLALLFFTGIVELSHYKKNAKKRGVFRGYLTIFGALIFFIINLCLLLTSVLLPEPVDESQNNKIIFLIFIIFIIIIIFLLIKKMLGKHPVRKALIIAILAFIGIIIWAINNPSGFHEFITSSRSFIAYIAYIANI